MASALYEEQRNSDESPVSVWCVHIHFPAFEDLTEKNFYWSTADQIELEDGNTYLRHLTTIPRGRHQTDRGNDYAEINVSNPDNALYQEILPYEDLFEKCSIKISQCYEVETDLYVSEQKFLGYLKDFTLNDDEHILAITAISDFSRPGFLIGNRILTRERCGTEFNVNGLLPATESICGWQTVQGGNPIFCSKFLKGSNGCESHNNSARFYAVTALSTATVEIVSGGGGGGLGGDDGGGWGGGSGSGPCFTEKVYMLMADDSIKPMNEVKAKDLHLGFDVFDNDRLVTGEVISNGATIVDEIWNASFDQDVLIESTKEHLFYLGNRLYAPVATLGTRPAMGMNLDRKKAKSHLVSIERSIEMVSVYHAQTSTNNFIITDENRNFYIFVHNQKISINSGFIVT